MPFTKIKNTDFFIEDNRIILSDEYLKQNRNRFKKITGSRFCNVLGLNESISDFKTWCMMVNIYSEPMDEIFANAGNIIEPKIRAWVEKQTGYKFKSYDPKNIGFDIFSDNRIFGGIPDGEPIDENGEINYFNAPMLEIKTTSIDSFVFAKENQILKLQCNENGEPIIKTSNGKLEKWFNDEKDILIPKEYLFQLGLYCYLRKINKGLFVICFLEYEDYLNPHKCNVDERLIYMVNYDVNIDEMKKYVDAAEQWYKQYIETGKSPEISDEDKQFIKEMLNE